MPLEHLAQTFKGQMRQAPATEGAIDRFAISELATQGLDIRFNEQPGYQQRADHRLRALWGLSWQEVHREHLFDALEEPFNLPSGSVELQEDKAGKTRGRPARACALCRGLAAVSVAVTPRLAPRPWPAVRRNQATRCATRRAHPADTAVSTPEQQARRAANAPHCSAPG